jgi:hypothetical protein
VILVPSEKQWPSRSERPQCKIESGANVKNEAFYREISSEWSTALNYFCRKRQMISRPID